MRILELIKKWTLIVVHSERGGGGGVERSEPPPPIDTQKIAADTWAAQQQYNPQAAALEFGIQQEYMPQMSQLYNQAREAASPGGAASNQQLSSNVLQNLMSPTGISPEQQAAQQATRTQAVQGAQEAQRTRANLGGGLYGGRAQAAEQRDINNLVNQFATQDIDRETQQRQQAQQAGLQLMAQYFGIPMQQFGYQSPVASGEASLAAGLEQRGQDTQLEQQNIQAQTAIKEARINRSLWSKFAGF